MSAHTGSAADAGDSPRELGGAASPPADVADADEPYRPPAESSRLNRRQRRAVDEVIRAMLAP
jgi:hypothetical protein